jgi:WD40 repeat protein
MRTPRAGAGFRSRSGACEQQNAVRGNGIEPAGGKTGPAVAIPNTPVPAPHPTAAPKTRRMTVPITPPAARTFAGHTHAVTALAFDRTGTLLASASWDQSARLWDVATGTPVREFKGHGKPVLAVALSADGATLATGGYDRTVRLWDAATGAEVRTLTGHAKDVSGVAFTPDGGWLASAGHDGTVRLWNLGRGGVTVASPGSYVRAIAFSPDGAVLVAAGETGVTAWTVPGLERIGTTGDWGTGHLAVSFAPGGTAIATAAEYTVRVGSLADNPKILSGHRSTVTAVAFRPDGQVITSGGKDHTIRFWNAGSGLETESLQGHTGAVVSLAFRPDGRVLASGSEDKTIRLWDRS